jgi:SAM-dependent methyltransferase
MGEPSGPVAEPFAEPHGAYVCPRCLGGLQLKTTTALKCGSCHREYPVENEIVDFSEGEHYDNFVPGQRLLDREAAGLDGEFEGAVSRTNFYLERLRPLAAHLNRSQFRVLDCGCGNGLSVDLLNRSGLATWGNDSSALRKWQWEGRDSRSRLLVCDSVRLPFRRGFFSAILCSGVLEHVGVSEQGQPQYSVRVLPERDEARIQLLRELLRVLGRNGVLWLDFPNGAFPIDFWHRGTAGLRIHSPLEGFLPRINEIEAYVRAVEPAAEVRVVSPEGRLQFRQVRRRWYGRLLSPAAKGYFRVLSHPLSGPLRRSWLNPYLVVEVCRGLVSGR